MKRKTEENKTMSKNSPCRSHSFELYTKSKEFFCFGKDRGMKTRKFKDLTIRDAFMFAAVMSDPEICRREPYRIIRERMYIFKLLEKSVLN